MKSIYVFAAIVFFALNLFGGTIAEYAAAAAGAVILVSVVFRDDPSGTGSEASIGVAVCLILISRAAPLENWHLFAPDSESVVQAQEPCPVETQSQWNWELPSFFSSRTDAGPVQIDVGEDGKFRATAVIGGYFVPMIVDMSAPRVMLRYEDAQYLGFTYRGMKFDTSVAFGEHKTSARAVTIASLKIRHIGARDVEAFILAPGSGSHSVLGNSFFAKIAELKVGEGKLVLFDQHS